MSIEITLEFSGGAELLFDKVKKHDISLPHQDSAWRIKQLLPWIRDNLLKEREELFLQGDTVRPGILVLVNDSDWELMADLASNNCSIAEIACIWENWITSYSQTTGSFSYPRYMAADTCRSDVHVEPQEFADLPHNIHRRHVCLCAHNTILCAASAPTHDSGG